MKKHFNTFLFIIFFIILSQTKVANAYREVSNKWYTKKIFNLDAVIQGYACAFSLSAKGFSKEEDVIEAIGKSFLGYKKKYTINWFC